MAVEQKLDKMLDEIIEIKINMARVDARMANLEKLQERIEEEKRDRKEADHVIEKVLQKHDKRLDCIEKRPVKWWNIGIAALITGGIGAVVGYFTRN